MRHVYNYRLEDIVNIDNYFVFLEIYLKENRILKKDMFKRTRICANSYRNFLKNPEKNKFYYYSIISREYGLTLPDKEEMEELSEFYSKIMEDILYKRMENLEEDKAIIEKVRKRNNPKNEKRILSIERILFEVLDLGINTALVDDISVEVQMKLMEEKFSFLKNYEGLIKNEYLLFYKLLNISYAGFIKKSFETEISEVKELCGGYHFLQALADKMIADAYYYSNDYINSLLYGMKAYESFVRSANFQRAIYTKNNMTLFFLTAGGYLKAYESAYELYLAFNTLTKRQQNAVLRGMIESLFFLKRYDEVYEFINLHKDKIFREEWKIEYLMTLTYLDKKDEVLAVYNSFMEKWKKEEYYEPYYWIVKAIYYIYIEHKDIDGQKVKLKKNLSQLRNLTFQKICNLYFGFSKE